MSKTTAPRASLARLIQPPETIMQTTKKTASLKILKPKSDALDKLDGPTTTLDLIKAARRKPEPLHKRDPALSKRERLKT